MEEVTVLQILQVAHPGSQGALQKAIMLDQSFNWIETDRIEQYAKMLKRISQLHDHGDANINIKIRDGEIISKGYEELEK